MSDITHDQARQYIEAAADNLLGLPERSELDHHLSTCAECRVFAGELDELNHSLTAAFHSRWDAIPAPAPQPRQVLNRVRKVRAQHSLWTAAQLLAGAAAIFLLIYAMDNLVGPTRRLLPTPSLTQQVGQILVTRTPQSRGTADLFQPTQAAVATPDVQINTLTSLPHAIFYVDQYSLYRKQYGQNPELILDMTGSQPDEGKVLAAWVLADEIILLREPGLQRVLLPKGIHEWIYRLDKPAYYGTLQSAANGSDLIYTASIQDPKAQFSYATRIGIYHLSESLVQPVLSIPQTVIPLGYSQDQKSLYVQPVGQDPTFDHVWRVNLANGKTVEEISLKGYGYGSPAVSPDGRWLVSAQQESNSAGQPETPFLGSYSLQQRPAEFGKVSFSDLSHAADLTWSENGQRLYFVLNPGDSMVARSSTETRIWSTAPGKWTLTQVDQLPLGSMHLVSASPEGDWLYLQGENSPEAALVDTGQGLHGLFQVPVGAKFAGWQNFVLQDPRPTQVPPTPAPGILGQVVNGYGDHAPAANIPLAVDQVGNSFTPQATTDAQGKFNLSSLSAGQHSLQSTWFKVPFTLSGQNQIVNLGVIKYPLVHPPQFMSQQASTDPGISALKAQGTKLSFQIIHTDPTWTRPTENDQRDQVWNRQPFADHGQIFFDWWFKQPATLYDTLDIFTYGIPGGPNLNPVGADWRYLLGLWNSPDFLSDPVNYSPQALNDILARRQLDVWLLGYQADEVRQLGDHYLVSVHPAVGMQVIRFQGNQAALSIHVVNGDQELIRLPKVCRTERDIDCGSEGS